MKFIVLLNVVIFSLTAFALETDNFMVWNKTLNDSTRVIDRYFHERIQRVLEASHGKSCEEVTFKIASHFRIIHPEKHPLELWLKNNLGTDYVYPEEKNYLNLSIYRDPFRFYLPFLKLSPNVQVGGIYFGTDKLMHFSSTGRRYLEHYLEKIKKGLTDNEAKQSAIKFGLLNEATILGTGLTGVLSYGDLEANYQGFLFYRKFCMGETDNYLKQVDGRWVLVNTPTILEYANPYWDETYNYSYFVPQNWNKVGPIITNKYCPHFQDQSVVERMEFYRSFHHQSFSLNYLKKLQSESNDLTPLAQDICKQF